MINIRDPIHGFISLDDLEAKVVQTYEFQRLRFISQLGTTSLVYPGSTHSRFEHSLGVLYLAKAVLEKLRLYSPNLNENDEKIFRLASLIHDIGHAPFSHFGEEAKLFKDGLDHELMGEAIVRNSELRKILSEVFGDEGIDRIVFIMKGAGGKPLSEADIFLSDLLTGQAGIDRMDYLIRDSHYTGVTYGKCDLPRLLETIRYDTENKLYWEEGGIHALEQFLLARYFMFKDVYFHKTRRILDYHLGTIIKNYLKEKEGEEFLPTDVSKYLQLTDNEVKLYLIKNAEASSIFIDRNFYKLISRKSKDHPDKTELLKWAWLEEKLSEKFGTDVYLDKAENAPYKFEKADQINVQWEGNIVPLQEASQLVDSLTPINQRRVYAKRGKRSDVNKFVRGFLDKRR